MTIGQLVAGWMRRWGNLNSTPNLGAPPLSEPPKKHGLDQQQHRRSAAEDDHRELQVADVLAFGAVISGPDTIDRRVDFARYKQRNSANQDQRQQNRAGPGEDLEYQRAKRTFPNWQSLCQRPINVWC